jgi:hypothetical protein
VTVSGGMGGEWKESCLVAAFGVSVAAGGRGVGFMKKERRYTLRSFQKK